MVALHNNPADVEPGFTFNLEAADALTDDMIDCVPCIEVVAEHHTLRYIEKGIGTNKDIDFTAYRPIYAHERFMARVMTGDPEAIAAYEAGVRYQQERLETIERERAELAALFSE